MQWNSENPDWIKCEQRDVIHDGVTLTREWGIEDEPHEVWMLCNYFVLHAGDFLLIWKLNPCPGLPDVHNKRTSFINKKMALWQQSITDPWLMKPQGLVRSKVRSFKPGWGRWIFQDVKILSTSPPGGTLGKESRVWDYWLVKEPQAWKNRPLSKI